MELTSDQALHKGIEAHKAGKVQEAERYYTAILKANPKHPDANHNMGILAFGVGKAQEALPFFKNALEVNPKIAQYWLSYLEALISLDNIAEARTVFDKAKAEEVLSEVDALFTDARIKEKMGNLDDVKSLYSKVIALEPANVLAHSNLGIIHFQTGNFSEAEASLIEAITLKADFAKAHFYLGNTLRALNRLEEAETSYRQAIALKLGYLSAYMQLAGVLRDQDRIQEALESEQFAKFIHTSNFDKNDSSKFLDYKAYIKPTPMEHALLYRPGMGTENVGGFLRAMAQMVRPKNILEIGAGYTTPFLLEALVNNMRVYDDGNLEPSYFENYIYEPKLVVIDDMSLGELSEKPGMKDIVSSKYTHFIEGTFQGKAQSLYNKYEAFDFVWFDCGGLEEYETFLKEYWDICSDYVFFHYTYTKGRPNELHNTILKNITGKPAVFDIIEPHKSRQGSITMVRKKTI